MNWKILSVLVISVISVIILGLLQIIGIPLATILTASISVILFVISKIGDMNKPKSSLHIEQPKLERKQYGDYQGYKLVTQVTNKGKKIVFNIEAFAKFKEKITVSHIKIQTTNNLKSYSCSNQPFEETKYSWIDNAGKTIGNVVSQLRKDDTIKLMFPPEYQSGYAWAIGLDSDYRPISRSGSATDTLLNLESKKTYDVELKLKGEDNDKITIPKEKKFKIEVP